MKNKKAGSVIILTACTVLVTLTICIISVKTANNILEENAEERLVLIKDNACMEFNASIQSIEQAVSSLSAAAVNHLDDTEAFRSDSAYVDSYTESLKAIMLYTVEHTTGAMSVYIRYNPEIAYPTSGAFYVYDEKSGDFLPEPPTDFSLYINDETGRTEWYDIPVSRGEPTWIEPYRNENISFTMVSYVVPIIIDDVVYGIIGMDIDYEYLCEMAQSVSAYDTGYVCLVNRRGEVIYHPRYELYSNYSAITELNGFNEIVASESGFGSYYYDGEKRTVACGDLDIGMILCVVAPDSEIYAHSITLRYQLIIVSAAALMLVTLVSAIVVVRLVKASETDELTGFPNRRCFVERYRKLDAAHLKEHTLFIMDIDMFKRVNDTYGHNAGDAALIFTAKTAQKILGKGSFIARWGGDEFIGLVKTAYAHERLEKLRSEIEANESGLFGSITVSIGTCPADSGDDLIRITEEADEALYKAKNSGRNRFCTSEAHK